MGHSLLLSLFEFDAAIAATIRSSSGRSEGWPQRVPEKGKVARRGAAIGLDVKVVRAETI